MQLTPLESAILIGCVRDLDEFSQRPAPGGYGFVTEKRIAHDAASGLVACSPARWLGYAIEDGAERMRVSRAYRSLEKRNLIDRVIGAGGRCILIGPTEAGKLLAAELQQAAGK